MTVSTEQKNHHRDPSELLLAWFATDQRPLPWRQDYHPYHVWISEVMLQQTQVNSVIPYYLRWMERFPDVTSIATASLDEILKYWEGLGYYSRAKNIYDAARILTAKYNGNLPRNYKQLLALPGVGPYSAGAIMSLAFNEKVAAIDGNVKRIFARLFDLDQPVERKEMLDFIREKVMQWIPDGQARMFNQALMELGALTCLARNPVCAACPIREFCRSLARGTVDSRPVRYYRSRVQSITAAIGVLMHRGRILIQKRPERGLMANLWEFPGGKVEKGETAQEALAREFREELELEVTAEKEIVTIRHAYTRFKVTLHAFLCRSLDNRPSPVMHSAVAYRWCLPKELDHYAFPAANRKLIRLLQTDVIGR